MEASAASPKATLTYFDGRGLGEMIRFMLGACGIPFDEVFVATRAEFLEVVSSGVLPFDQLPSLHIDGMHLSQSMSVVRYLARRGGLYGDGTAKSAAECDVIGDGIRDMLSVLSGIAFQKDLDAAKARALERARNKFLPCIERLLAANASPAGSEATSLASDPTEAGETVEEEFVGPFLVGSTLTYPDVTIAEVLCAIAELSTPEEKEHLASSFPLTAAHHLHMLQWRRMRDFFASGKRHRFPDAEYVATVRECLNMS
jgi:glutathione S-transferase